MCDEPRTILVVDDDLEIRETLKDVLEEEGYDVDAAANGVEALAILRRDGARLPSLIVLDLMMPQMNGWEFCEVQRADPALSPIPVLVISAASSDGGRASIQGNPRLRKPVELVRLLEAVARYAR